MDRLIIFVVVVVVYVIYRVIRGATTPNAPTPPRYATTLQDTAPPPAPHFPHGGKSFPFSEILPDEHLPEIRSIRTKIRGVTKANADSSHRQQIIRLYCHPGDALCFVREPSNPFDRNAIQARRVVCSDVPDKQRVGEQVGYLSAHLAEEFAALVDDAGWILMAEITDITGGNDGEPVGVNIRLAAYMPDPEPKTCTPRRKQKSRPLRGRL